MPGLTQGWKLKTNNNNNNRETTEKERDGVNNGVHSYIMMIQDNSTMMCALQKKYV